MDENPKSEDMRDSDMMICKSLLRDVTNVDKMRRKSAHKEAVEKTASPNFCTKELKKSLEGKENDEVCIYKINFKIWVYVVKMPKLLLWVRSSLSQKK